MRLGIKRKLLLIILTSVLFVALIYSYDYFWRNYKSEEFVDQWSSRFLKCPDMESLAQNYPNMYIRKFDNGEWLAIVHEHSCMDGAGYDVSVFYDSTGAIRYDKGHNFCGYEGLSCEMNRIEAKSAQEFYSQLTFLNLRTRFKGKGSVWRREQRRPGMKANDRPSGKKHLSMCRTEVFVFLYKERLPV